MKRLFFSLLLLAVYPLWAMEEQKPTVALSFRNILTTNTDKEVLIKAALATAPKILIKHPTMIFHTNQIITMGKEIAGQVNGTGNIINTLATKLEQKGWGKLSEKEIEAIMKLAIYPKPIHDNIVALQQLKKEGYSFIGATNMDNEHYRVFRNQLNEKYQTSLNDLLDTVVTPPLENVLPYFNPNAHTYNLYDNGIFVARHPYPHKSFFHTMRTATNVTYEEQNRPICYFVSEGKQEQIEKLQEESWLENLNITISSFESVKEIEKIVAEYAQDQRPKEINDLD